MPVVYVEDTSSVLESWRKLVRHGAMMVYPAQGAPFGVNELGKVMDF